MKKLLALWSSPWHKWHILISQIFWNLSSLQYNWLGYSAENAYFQKKIVKLRCLLGYSAPIHILYCKLDQFQKIRETNVLHLCQGLDQSTKSFFTSNLFIKNGLWVVFIVPIIDYKMSILSKPCFVVWSFMLW